MADEKTTSVSLADSPNADQVGNQKPKGPPAAPTKSKSVVYSDPFILESVFPNVVSLLHVPPSVNEILRTCVYVLDANTLLAPYATSKESLDELGGIYKRLVGQHRLYVPARAIREYARHRAEKLKESYYSLTQGKDRLQPISPVNLSPVESSESYKKLEEIRVQANEKIGEYKKVLGELIDQLKVWNRNDDVSKLYSELFTADVILDHDASKEDLKADLDKRVFHNLPPGFHDHDKPDGGIGDLHIWHTILKAGSVLGKNIVFVSLDEKNDWMVRVNKEALYVREELVNEFFVKTGRHFAAVNLSTFLKSLGASAKTVDEVNAKQASFVNPKEFVTTVLSSAVHSMVKEFLMRVESGDRSAPIDYPQFESYAVELANRWQRRADTDEQYRPRCLWLTTTMRNLLQLNKMCEMIRRSGGHNKVRFDSLIDICRRFSRTENTTGD